MRKRRYHIWLILAVLPLLLALADLYTGSVHFSFREITDALLHPGGGDDVSVILHRFRLPRMWTAILAGVALSVSGLLMQTLFRNPLAGPYVLGISAGASLGVALLVLGFPALLSFAGGTLAANTTVMAAAVAGATAVLLLIMAVSLRVRDIMTILILGIMFGSAVTALVSILQYFSNETLLKVFVVWTMGSLASVTGSQTLLLALLVAFGVLLTLLLVRPLNLLLMGEDYARSVGMHIRRTRILIFLVTGLLAGGVTAFCGPIGFVGIVVPHLARITLRTSDVRQVLPATLLLGASLLLLGDILSHLPGEGGVLPINAVTAVLGIPMIIWMVLQRQRLSSLM